MMMMMMMMMIYTVASTRLQQQKQQLHRLQLQASAASSAMSGCTAAANMDSLSTFGLHPASFVFSTFPTLSTLVADWKNLQGQQLYMNTCHPVTATCSLRFIHSFIHQGRQLAVGSLSTCLSAYRQH